MNSSLVAHRIRELVSSRLSWVERRLSDRVLSRLVDRLVPLSGDGSDGSLAALGEEGLSRIERELESLAERRRDLARRLDAAADDPARREIRIRFLHEIEPARRSQGRRGRRELERFVDAGLVEERVDLVRFELEREMELAARLVAAALAEMGERSAEDRVRWVEERKTGRALVRFAGLARRRRTRLALLSAARLAASAGGGAALGSLAPGELARAAFDTTGGCRVRTEALRALVEIDPAGGRRAAWRLLLEGAREDIFARRGALAVALEGETDGAALSSLRDLLLSSREPDFLLQAAAKAAAGIENGVAILLEALTIREHTSKARAAFVAALGEAASRSGRDRVRVGAALGVLSSPGEDALVARVAFEEAVRLSAAGKAKERRLDEVDRCLLAALDSVIESAETPPQTRRQAGEARERILLEASPLRDPFEPIKVAVASAPAGSILSFDREGDRGGALEPEELGRFLVLAAAHGHGVQVVVKPRRFLLHVGDRFGTRLWRILYELLHPAPDKRKGYPHWVGRRVTGTIRAPSGVLAELSRTRVPGERVYNEIEGSWRPYLPHVDDFLASTTRALAGRPVRIHTFQGVTEVRGPVGMARLAARARLVTRYAEFDRLRSDPAANFEDAARFVARVRELGFSISFVPRAYEWEGRWFAARDPTLDAIFGVPAEQSPPAERSQGVGR